MTAMGMRSFRVPDELWQAAQRVAYERDEDVSAVLRRLMRGYVEEAARWTV